MIRLVKNEILGSALRSSAAAADRRVQVQGVRGGFGGLGGFRGLGGWFGGVLVVEGGVWGFKRGVWGFWGFRVDGLGGLGGLWQRELRGLGV